MRGALVNSERFIVTTMPIFKDRLEKYWDKLTKEKRGKLYDRLRFIESHEAKEFYRYRGRVGGKWVTLPPFGKGDEFTYSAETFGAGVTYIIDEVHVHFGARQWASVPKAAVDYFTQHRKCGDEIYAITQNLGQVEKTFRNLAEDYTQITNEGRQKLLMMWAQPPVFSWELFYGIPGPMTKPGDRGTFTLEKGPGGLANCYDTAAGEGVRGVLADKDIKIPGLPFWTLPLCVLGVCVGLWKGIQMAPVMFGRLANSIASSVTGTNNIVQDYGRHVTTPTGERVGSEIAADWGAEIQAKQPVTVGPDWRKPEVAALGADWKLPKLGQEVQADLATAAGQGSVADSLTGVMVTDGWVNLFWASGRKEKLQRGEVSMRKNSVTFTKNGQDETWARY